MSRLVEMMLQQLRSPHQPGHPDPAILAHRRQLAGMLWPLLGVGAAVLVIGTPLLFAPRYPLVLDEPAIALGVLGALGTIGIAMLQRQPGKDQERRLWWLTELTGWTITLGCLVLFAPYPTTKAPAGLLFAAASAAAGRGLIDPVRGLLVCEMVLAGFAAAQRYLLHVSDDAGAQETVISWTTVILVVAIITRLILWARPGALEGVTATKETMDIIGQPRLSVTSPASTDPPPTIRTTPDDLLSPRERETLVYLATFCKVPQIAGALGVTPKTIDTHQATIAQKLGMPTTKRDPMIAEARQRGLFTDEEVAWARERAVRATPIPRRAPGAKKRQLVG